MDRFDPTSVAIHRSSTSTSEYTDQRSGTNCPTVNDLTLALRASQRERSGRGSASSIRRNAERRGPSPAVLVRDNLTTRHDTVMRQLIAARTWLTVSLFPAYAPELNPVQGGWAPSSPRPAWS